MDKIKIKKFRSVENKTFDLKNNLLAFVGENNSGKSTVLNAIRILNNLNYEPSINDIRHGKAFFEISIVKI